LGSDERGLKSRQKKRRHGRTCFLNRSLFEVRMILPERTGFGQADLVPGKKWSRHFVADLQPSGPGLEDRINHAHNDLISESSV
jgi:hypothetical protein